MRVRGLVRELARGLAPRLPPKQPGRPPPRLAPILFLNCELIFETFLGLLGWLPGIT